MNSTKFKTDKSHYFVAEDIEFVPVPECEEKPIDYQKKIVLSVLMLCRRDCTFLILILGYINLVHSKCFLPSL